MTSRHWVARAGACCWLLMCHAYLATSTDPTLDPATLEDQYGNAADANSDITWADIAEPEYNVIKDYDDGQLRGLLNMKDGFIDALQKDRIDTSEYGK